MTPNELEETGEAARRELRTLEGVAGGHLAREIGLHPLGEVFPNVHRWMGLVEAMPAYERTYPPHWRTAR